MNNIPIEFFMKSFGDSLTGGGFDYYFKPTKNIKSIYFDNYFNDTEHGFFHAFCCSFISYLINSYNIDKQLVSSLLLHDFLKCNGFSQEEHDIELENYYPNLLTETYSHSNPPNQNKILIICDRLELQRYPDHGEWIDTRFFETLNSLTKNQRDDIEIFYNEVRPSLLFYYEQRNKKNSNMIITTIVDKFYNIIDETLTMMISNNSST